MSAFSFSEPVISPNVCFSPNGFYASYTVHNHEKLWIQDVKDGDVSSFKTLLSTVDFIAWSLDSIYVACGSAAQGLIEVFSLADRKWKCKIDVGNETEGGVGLLDFCWSITTRHLLTTASEHIELTVWGLEEKDVYRISDVVPIQDFKSFSPDGKQLAVAKFRPDDGSKYVHVYDTRDWRKCLLSFNCKVKDMAGVRWGSMGQILLWDSPLFSNLYIYSGQGELLRHYSPDGLSLGIQFIEPSPTGQFIAFVNHKDKIRVLNNMSYGITLDETLEESLLLDYPDCVIYGEKMSSITRECTYEVKQEVTLQRKNSSKAVSSKIKFSWDGKQMAILTSNFPTTIWIWDISSTKLTSLLQQQQPITDFSWDPTDCCLSLVTGSDYLYFYKPQECFTVKIPDDFCATQVEWNADGLSLLVSDCEKFSVCYLH